MEYRGTFEDGVIKPDQPLSLPNGTPVEFHPVNGNGAAASPPPGAFVMLSEDERKKLADQFRRGKTLEELIREQGVKPLGSVEDLAVDWPDADPADSPDEFIRHLREWRK